MLEECYRHAKVIGAWGEGVQALDAVGLTGALGVVAGDDATAVFTDVQALMVNHRVWERFPSALA
jgi:catalase